jgi:hypothetical protein
MPDYKLNIIGTFNNKQLVKALRGAGIDVKKLGKNVDKTNKQMGAFRTATAGLRRTLGAVRNNLLLVSFAFGGVAAVIKKTTGMFAEFEKINIGFKNLGQSAKLSENALQTLTDATDGTVNSMELMRQANNAMLLGIVESEDQMGEMFDVAQRLASALGKDTLFGIESLTTGIGRQSRLMLDNLGIIVKTEDAYKSYAAELKKNVSELTEQERKTAFITAAMDSAREKVKALGDEQLTTKDKFNQTTTAISHMSIQMGEFFAPAAVLVSDNIGDAARGVSAFFRELSESSLETAVRQLREMGSAAEDIALLQNLVDIKSHQEVLLNNKKILKNLLEDMSSLDEEQLRNLGVQFDTDMKRVKANNEMFLQETTRKTLTKEELLTQKNIRKEISKIQAENFALMDVKGDISEQTANEIQLNLSQFELLAEMLLLVKQRETAERVLFGIEEDRIKLLSGTGEKGANDISEQTIKASELNNQIQELIKKYNETSGEGAIKKALFGDRDPMEFLNSMISVNRVLGEYTSLLKKIDIPEMEFIDTEGITKLEEFLGMSMPLFNEIVVDGMNNLNQGWSMVAKTASMYFSSVQEGFQQEMQELKAGDEYKKASSKKKQKLEDDLLKRQKTEKEKAWKNQRALTLTQITMDTASAIVNSLTAKPPWAGVALAITAGVTGATQFAIAQSQKMPSFAEGGDFVTSGPQAIIVGDNPSGREHIQITPLGGDPAPNAPSSPSITVNVSGNVMSSDYVEGELAEQIKEAIRRGTDFGIS